MKIFSRRFAVIAVSAAVLLATSGMALAEVPVIDAAAIAQAIQIVQRMTGSQNLLGLINSAIGPSGGNVVAAQGSQITATNTMATSSAPPLVANATNPTASLPPTLKTYAASTAGAPPSDWTNSGQVQPYVQKLGYYPGAASPQQISSQQATRAQLARSAQMDAYSAAATTLANVQNENTQDANTQQLTSSASSLRSDVGATNAALLILIQRQQNIEFLLAEEIRAETMHEISVDPAVSTADFTPTSGSTAGSGLPIPNPIGGGSVAGIGQPN
jgi:hypothetical protein